MFEFTDHTRQNLIISHVYGILKVCLNLAPKGFTLVELLVVISIIAILSVIGITVFSSAQKSGRDAKRRMDLKAIAQALEQYKMVNGAYPYNGGVGWVHSTAGSNWMPDLNSFFTGGSVPQDPVNNGAFFDNTAHYGYSYYTHPSYGGTEGSWFMLVGVLESPTAADLATQCTTPNGTVFNYGTQYQNKAFMICNQQ